MLTTSPPASSPIAFQIFREPRLRIPYIRLHYNHCNLHVTFRRCCSVTTALGVLFGWPWPVGFFYIHTYTHTVLNTQRCPSTLPIPPPTARPITTPSPPTATIIIIVKLIYIIPPTHYIVNTCMYVHYSTYTYISTSFELYLYGTDVYTYI